MSYGKMNKFAEIIRTHKYKDKEGFVKQGEHVLASVRVYQEGRHGSERWANLAAFSVATGLFRFRRIPRVKPTTHDYIVCEGKRYEIVSVEDVKGRGMYIEILAKISEGDEWLRQR